MTIHPAKTPMEGGFSLEKFMPNTDPEIDQVLRRRLTTQADRLYRRKEQT
jgi:hypothetical protein